MSYSQALGMAWDDIKTAEAGEKFSVKLLSDTYDVDLEKRSILSASCNVPANDHISIIILHYLSQKLRLKVLPEPSGEWVDFNRIEGGEGYYPAFRKRTIGHILKKYGTSPCGLIEAAGRFPSKKGTVGDASVIIYPFEEVPILVTMWKGDDEVGPEANILFDRNISGIFRTEDIVVLTEFVTHSL